MDYLLFSHDPAYARRAAAAGMSAIVVDWEWRGKVGRQAGQDTEINHAGIDDLLAIRDAVDCRVICRVNNQPEWLKREVDLALDNGADEIWLPMFRHIHEVDELLGLIDGRASLGVLVETRDAMRLGRELDLLPLSRVYIGLHDYRIDSGGSGLFEPIIDGTLDRFRESYRGAFGFAGITRPDGGHPIPQRLLLAAMHRLGCCFGVARRGFRAAVADHEIAAALADLNAANVLMQSREIHHIDAHHHELKRLIECVNESDNVRRATATRCAS